MKKFAITALTLFSTVALLATDAFAQAENHNQPGTRRVVRKVRRTQTTQTSTTQGATTRRVIRRTTSTPRVVRRAAEVTYPAPLYQSGTPYYRTPVYRRSYPTFVQPNFAYYSANPQVFRYVRSPRYVWAPYEPSRQQNETVYVYDNTRYVVQEATEPEGPELDCPRDASMQRSPYRSWCATARGTKHGPFVAYYENGQVRTEGYFQFGRRDGTWIEYFPNGAVRTEGSYLDGEKTGTWITYSRNGEEVTTIFYN